MSGVGQLSFSKVLGDRGWRPHGLKRLTHQPIQGFTLRRLWRLLRANEFAVDPGYRDKLLYLWVTAPLHSLFGRRERRLYDDAIRRTSLAAAPLFVIGHWRSGTTMLHNLLARDPAHTFPRAYQAFVPTCFLLPRMKLFLKLLRKWTDLKVRPMDNVVFSFDEPWEDEFMMLALTGQSPYARVLFPRRLGPDNGYRYPDLGPGKRQWQQAFHRLLQRLTLLEPKRLVLKSPPHMGRLEALLELYPEAKFVHVVRHPYSVFPSNLRVWRDAFALSFLQEVDENQVTEMVFSTYIQLFERFFRARDRIPHGNLVEVRYEDLVANPLETIEEIYGKLGLPGFGNAAPFLRNYVRGLRGYHGNGFTLSAGLKRLVYQRWRRTFECYGYR